ncbi:MAG: hypothetical protein F6K40_09630 [Okeania sp. SIO3I5]|uniref:hypothetical protein n=1 Tax=Okeania sp. SIO3I5 TaxID=2607805 RepID=UPI0013B71D99|nr:hypothetical protein [Okeania sp. SIO3I5]NEQ36523.1 hypothetical protein [Okeania sp. SIO3I5]
MKKIKTLAKKIAFVTIILVNLFRLMSVENGNYSPLIIQLIFQPNIIEVTLQIEMKSGQDTDFATNTRMDIVNNILVCWVGRSLSK